MAFIVNFRYFTPLTVLETCSHFHGCATFYNNILNQINRQGLANLHASLTNINLYITTIGCDTIRANLPSPLYRYILPVPTLNYLSH